MMANFVSAITSWQSSQLSSSAIAEIYCSQVIPPPKGCQPRSWHVLCDSDACLSLLSNVCEGGRLGHTMRYQSNGIGAEL